MSERIAKENVFARYVGNGFYVPGLGACDLTRDEWFSADVATRSKALKLSLYELSEPDTDVQTYGVEQAQQETASEA